MESAEGRPRRVDASALGARELAGEGLVVAFRGQDEADEFQAADGVGILCGRRVATQNTHGTGCTLSSAIASLRPRRATWLEAVRDAKDYLTGAIAHAEALGVGHGRGPVHHFYRVWTRTGW